MYIVQFLNPNGTIDFVTDMILSANSSIAVSEVGSAMVVFPSLPAAVINKISSQPDYLVELYWKAILPITILSFLAVLLPICE